MDAVKEAVIEERLDELARQFRHAEERNRDEHREIRAELRAEIGGLRTEMNEGFQSIHARLENLDSNLHSFQRSVVTILGSVAVTGVGAIVTVAAAQLF